MEARDEGQRLNLQRQPYHLNLRIIDELGFVPLSPTGAELLFEVFSQRYERGSILVTTNLSFDEWTLKFTIMSSVVRWSKHIDYSLPPLTKGLCRPECRCMGASLAVRFLAVY